MNKTTIRLSEFTQDRLKEIAQRKGLSVSQLINEISLRYIGAEEGARMMAERAARGSKAKALAALEVIRKADRPLPTEDQLAASREKPRHSSRRAKSRQA
jgi:predicted DNA-binding protein